MELGSPIFSLLGLYSFYNEVKSCHDTVFRREGKLCHVIGKLKCAMSDLRKALLIRNAPLPPCRQNYPWLAFLPGPFGSWTSLPCSVVPLPLICKTSSNALQNTDVQSMLNSGPSLRSSLCLTLRFPFIASSLEDLPKSPE